MPPQWSAPLLNLTLRGGSVYYFQHRDLTSPEPHYFIVLNLDPCGDEFLVLAVSSSNIVGVHDRNSNLPTNTLVEITPAEYADFTRHSIVDCNHLFRKTKNELLEKLRGGVACEKSSMPSSIVDRLRQGVLASPLVEDSVKVLLRDSH